MVAKHPHSRIPSIGSSRAEKSNKDTRHPSLRGRLSDGPLISLIPSIDTDPNVTLTPLSGSRCTHSLTNTQENTQTFDRRRPFASTLRSSSNTSSVPHLSIADRFMSTNYNQPRNISPSPSTVVSLDHEPPPPTTSTPDTKKLYVDTSKLSVAERFMSSNSSMHSNDTLSIPMRERSASNFSGRTLLNPTSPVFTLGPKRLAIADAFMKHSSLQSSSPESTGMNRTRSRSIMDELDLGHRHSLSDVVHPLEGPGSRRSAVLDNNLNLDLSITSPSGTVNGRNPNRPWGSQETLVQSDRKKPIYSKFIEAGKHVTHSIKELSEYCPTHRSYSMDEHLVERHDERGDCDQKISLEEERPLAEEVSSVLTLKNHEEKEDRYAEDPVTMEAAHPKKYVREIHREPRTHSTEPSQVLLSTNSPPPPPHSPPRSFWIGCCFFSCGQRPNQASNRHPQQRRDKEGEERHAKANSNCGRRSWVICTFISVILLAVIAYFLWPRTPLMRIEGASLTSQAKITQTRQGIMVGNTAFETEWLVNVTVDNRQNRVPTRLVAIQVIAKDSLTGLLIGKGLHNSDPNPETIILPPRAISTIQLPIRVDYQARDASDTTFVDLTKACTPQSVSVPQDQGQRESLQLHFWITLHIFGLDWLGYKPTVIATPATGGFACPT
ncbi:hypothetical protein BDF14DRAFT_1883442 [Spinellus fusiger]|nr:hypothetical protein BDF14DRAFT_1883442 [Spinellus fusiger]